MNAKKCAQLARDHFDDGDEHMALNWLIDAVVKLAGTERIDIPDRSTWMNVRMTAKDAAVYAEAVKTMTMILAKYGAVTP